MKLSLQDTFGAVIEADTYERVDLSRAKGFYIAPKVKIQILILNETVRANIPAGKYERIFLDHAADVSIDEDANIANLSGARNFELSAGMLVNNLFLEGCRKFVIPKGLYNRIFLNNALDFAIVPGAIYREIAGADPKLVRLAQERGKQLEQSKS